jgi:hypothetical protein
MTGLHTILDRLDEILTEARRSGHGPQDLDRLMEYRTESAALHARLLDLHAAAMSQAGDESRMRTALHRMRRQTGHAVATAGMDALDAVSSALAKVADARLAELARQGGTDPDILALRRELGPVTPELHQAVRRAADTPQAARAADGLTVELTTLPLPDVGNSFGMRRAHGRYYVSSRAAGAVFCIDDHGRATAVRGLDLASPKGLFRVDRDTLAVCDFGAGSVVGFSAVRQARLWRVDLPDTGPHTAVRLPKSGDARGGVACVCAMDASTASRRLTAFAVPAGSTRPEMWNPAPALDDQAGPYSAAFTGDGLLASTLEPWRLLLADDRGHLRTLAENPCAKLFCRDMVRLGTITLCLVMGEGRTAEVLGVGPAGRVARLLRIEGGLPLALDCDDDTLHVLDHGLGIRRFRFPRKVWEDSLAPANTPEQTR